MNDFDKVSNFYNFLEKISFGDYLQCFRESLLYKSKSKNILLIGEGTGNLLNYFKSFPDSKITIVESSTKMCEILKIKCIDVSDHNISIINESFFDFDASIYYDIICTSFFLDCFSQNDCNLCILKITKLLCVSGHWLNIDFYNPKCRSLSGYYFRFVIRVLFNFFRKTASLGSSNLPIYSNYSCGNLVLTKKTFSFSPPLFANLKRKLPLKLC